MKKIFILFVLMTLVGCQQASSRKDGGAGGYDNGKPPEGAGYHLQGGDLFDAQGNKISRIFLFPLDSFQVSESDRQAVLTHARFLKASPDVRVKVEGHGDERGSREYNLALGQRRAKSVAQILEGNGVPGARIVSYGEERPRDQSHSESAWGKNRRVELLY